MKRTKHDITGAWFGYEEMTIPAGTRVTDIAAGGCKLSTGFYFIDEFGWVAPYEDGTKKSGFIHDAVHRGITVTSIDVEEVES